MMGHDNWGDLIQEISETNNFLYHECLKDMEKIYGRKRAKESARYFKMYNSQIQSDVSFNMRSFANFLKLRMSENAQVEIQRIAWDMYRLVENTGKFYFTLRAMGY